MRKVLIACTLLLGTASGLTAQQREQHINQIFSSAGITLIKCTGTTATNVTMFCGQTRLSDSLVRQSWDLYADWTAKVSHPAKHLTAWKLSDTGKSYSAAFRFDDGDFYVVTTSIGSSDNFVIASWSGSTQQTSPSTTSATQSSGSSSQAKKPQSKCDPKVNNIATVDGHGWAYGSWVEPASFPTPSKEYKLGGPFEDYSIVCPSHRADFKSSTGEYTFKGSSFNDIILYSGLSYFDNVSSVDFYEKSEGVDELTFVGITYNKSTSKFELTARNSSIFTDLPIGYRVDGGALKALYFEGKVYPIDLPSNAKVLEIYASPSKLTGWQYLKVDFTNNSVTLKRNYPFPTN